MRLFIAINFPDEIKAAIAQVRDGIKKAALRGNFTLDANLHLTLVFLGECDSRQVLSIKSVLEEIRLTSFPLMLEKAGYFKRDGGNTWWIGLKENKPLSGLQSDLLSGMGVEAVMQRYLKDFRQVEISRQDIGLVAEGTGFHAAAGTPLAGVGHGFAGVEQFLDDGLGVIKCRLAPALPGDFAGPL